MRTYIVTYEINDQIRKDTVKKILQAYESYCPILENACAIITLKRDLEIVQDINDTLISEDRLFVMETKKNASWVNTYGEEHSEWLVNNL